MRRDREAQIVKAGARHPASRTPCRLAALQRSYPKIGNREAAMGEPARSYVHGASDVPLIGQTIGSYLDGIAEAAPDRPALVVRPQNIRWSYGEFRAQVDAMAAGLIALGLEPGERLGIWSPNNAEWVTTQFASAKAGLILVNINPAYRLHE